MDPLLIEKRPEIEALCKRLHVAKLFVFGSAATGTRRPGSDFDFAYVFTTEGEKHHGQSFFELWFGLQAILGKHVDLVSPAAQRNPVFIQELKATQQLYYAENQRVVQG